MDVNTALETRREEMERAAVSSDGTSGKPPVSSVESVREKSATWYLSQILPKIGQPHANAIHKIAAALGDGEAVDAAADGQRDQQQPEDVVLQPFAEGQQAEGHGRQLGAHLVIELRQTAAPPR